MPSEIMQTIANLATAVGVGVAAWQLFESCRHVQSQFEDGLLEHYREISRRLPLDALLGRPLTEEQLRRSLTDFYQYFDLSNEQALLGSKRRLRRRTWENWREGIQQHMARPAFRQAWTELAPDLDGSFDAFRLLFPAGRREAVKLNSKVSSQC